MTRGKRVIGQSGYMHIIARGIDRGDIFFDDEDYGMYIAILRHARKMFGFSILAYCLMTNHVHLVIHDEGKGFSQIMHNIGLRYAKYFNRKYGRSGHLFQDRFKSKTIESERYLLTVVRYIHYNPVNAGMCSICDYRWSSYQEYVGNKVFCSTDMVLDMLGGIDGFVEFHNSVEGDDSDLELTAAKPLSDIEAKEIMCGMLQSDDPRTLSTYNVYLRDKKIRELKKWGLPNAQIARLSGLTISVVRRPHL